MSPKIIITSLAATLLLPSALRADADDKPAPDADKTTPQVTVQTGALKLATLHQYITAFGMVAPEPATSNSPAADAIISAPSPGTVKKIDLAEGQHVDKGQLLAELNSGTVTYENAEQQLARQQTLYKQQNTSLKNLQDAETQLALLQVKAPISGTAVHVNVNPGQAVDLTTAIAEIMDLNRLVVGADIPVANIGDLKLGQPAQILTDPPLATEVVYIAPTVNTSNDTVLAAVYVPTNSICRPGQFVRLRITTAAHTNCLAAPADSIVTDEDGKSTIALVKGDEAEPVPVQTGFREDGWVEVSGDGLKAGDVIVTVGAYALPGKSKIRVENPAAPTEK